jgi:hypothetical protein
MAATDTVARRRAVEALRAGVPCRSSVAVLGSGQPHVEEKFADLLDQLAHSERRSAPGILLGGGFGVGKSHLLTHLAHQAIEAGAAVSTVVVSKETPLHDPAKVFRAAQESLSTGTASGDGVVAEAAASLDPDTLEYAALTRWVNSPGSGMDERFAATLLVHERLRGGDLPGADDAVEEVVRFWRGDPLRVSDLKRALKSVGQGGVFSFGPLPARDLARQRMRFLAHLLRASGRTGLVVLFDEVELIGRYSLLQRARSYAELAGWLNRDHVGAGDPLFAVLAMTDDFEAAVLSGKNDRELIPTKLRDKQTPEWDEVATAAVAGMRHIDRDLVLLDPPTDTELDRVYVALKRLHGDAFGWDPPDVAGLERLGATRMRQYVRAWINEWDLVMLDPSYQPRTEVVAMTSSYDEDEDL